MRLPEKKLEWRIGGWTLGGILCPGIWRIGVWWDGGPYSFAITLPFLHLWCQHDGGAYWRWDWTIDIECEYDKFYDDDRYTKPAAHLRLFSKARELCECELEDMDHSER